MKEELAAIKVELGKINEKLSKLSSFDSKVIGMGIAFGFMITIATAAAAWFK